MTGGRRVSQGVVSLSLPGPEPVLVNGSFEQGVLGDRFATLPAGSNALPGWIIEDGGVDYIGSFWEPADGGRSIDMAASSPGTLVQTIETQPGQLYEVQFDLAGNPGGDPDKWLLVAAGDQEQSFFFDATGRSKTDMGWTRRTFRFFAEHVETTLEFLALGSDDVSHGPALDNVSVSVAD